MSLEEICKSLGITFTHWEQKSINKFDFKNSVFYDVGAHLGLWSIAALLNGAKRVIAFEPNEIYRFGATLSRPGSEIWRSSGLLPNFRSLGFDGKWVVIEATVTSEAYLDEGNHKVTIDHLENQVEPPDIIKIDVEGMELSVLKGAEKTIRRYKPKLMVETHGYKHGNMKELVMNLLRNWGYSEPDVMYIDEPRSNAHHLIYEL